MKSTRLNSMSLKFVILSLLVSSLSIVSQSSANAAEQTFDCEGDGSYTVVDGILASRMVDGNPTSPFSNDCSGDVVLHESVLQIGVPGSSQLPVVPSGVTSITIPAETTSIYLIPFQISNPSFQGIFVHPDNLNYKAISGVLFSKDGTVLIQYPSLGDIGYDIPAGVIQINDNAFRLLRNT